MTEWTDGPVRVLLGEALERLRELPDASVDAVVTDAPYELDFMGQGWDRSGVAFDPATWAEVLRIAKPGAYLLSFGGTRTYHRMACAVEDAGWEIRDMIEWIYGSGFPKNAKVALKPAHEPICMARKPFRGSVAANVLAHGTGTLNIAGCRVGIGAGGDREGEASADRRYADQAGDFAMLPGPRGGDARGRWPANVAFSHGEGCVPMGTRRVRGTNLHGPNVYGSIGYHGGGGGVSAGYGGPEGMETVEAWECVAAATVRVERFVLPDGTTIEPATTGLPLLLVALEVVRGLLPSASHSADTQSTPVSELGRDRPASTPAGSLDDCPADCRSGDGPLLREAAADRSSLRQLVDALESALALGRSARHSPLSPPGDRPSNWDDAPESSNRARTAQNRTGGAGSRGRPASDETASSTAGTESPGPLPGAPGGSTRVSSNGEDGCASPSIPSRSAHAGTGSEFRHQAANALRVASRAGVVACDDYTVGLPGCPVAELDRQSGTSISSGGFTPGSTGVLGRNDYGRRASPDREAGTLGFGDTGGASRFFYVAKASTRERSDGLPPGQRNVHPTVKPVALMRYLCRLVTPAGGLILDPFAGSGTTGVAAVLEGFGFVGIEQDPESVRTAVARLQHWQHEPDLLEAR